MRDSEAIPPGARILHIADAIDAMLSARSYKPGYSLDRVLPRFMPNWGPKTSSPLERIAV